MSVSAQVRHCVILCLLVALPWCGFASALAGLLGASHFHADSTTRTTRTSVASALLQLENIPFKALYRPLFSHKAAPASEHAHDDVQRHRHDAADSNVLALEAGGVADAARAELDTSAGKAAASLLPLFCFTDVPVLVDSAALHSPWGGAFGWSLQTAEVRALRRPPRA